MLLFFKYFTPVNTILTLSIFMALQPAINIENMPAHFLKFPTTKNASFLSELFHLGTFKNWENLKTEFSLTL